MPSSSDARMDGEDKRYTGMGYNQNLFLTVPLENAMSFLFPFKQVRTIIASQNRLNVINSEINL